jgi:acyl-CoA reductase-like NAD-dependent aldehyde dehydrogenase
MKHYDNFIDGKFVSSTSNNSIEVHNPSTGSVICTVPDSTASDVKSAISAATKAQSAWEKRPAIERARFMKRLAQRIRENTESLARVIVEEQGKILGLAQVEVAFTADYIDYMAEWARRIEGEVLESDRAGESIFLFRQPIGVVGGILPWNFPFFLIARKAAPALVAGNTIVIKPSEETPHNAVRFCELLAQTDLPAGVMKYGASILTGGKRGVGDTGYFYEPTVLADCRHDMEIIRREIFGPVLPVVTFSDLDEAIAYANDSEYGLTSSVYTRDLNVALKVSRQIRFGETYINREHFEAMQGFHSGWRKSGIGGADGKYGLYEFMQTHVVYMQSTP